MSFLHREKPNKFLWVAATVIVILVIANVWTLLGFVKSERRNGLAAMKVQAKVKTLQDEKKELLTKLKTAEQMVTQANAGAKEAVPTYNSYESRYLGRSEDEQRRDNLASEILLYVQEGNSLFESNPKKTYVRTPFTLGVGKGTVVPIGCEAMKSPLGHGMKVLQIKPLLKGGSYYAVQMQLEDKKVWLHRGASKSELMDHPLDIPELKIDSVTGDLAPSVRAPSKLMDLYFFGATKDKVFLVADQNAC